MGRSKSSLCDEGLITGMHSLIFLLSSAHTPFISSLSSRFCRECPHSDAHLSHKSKQCFFLVRASQIQSVAVAMRSWLHQAQPHSVWNKSKKILQLNDLSHWRCQTNMKWSFKCLKCVGQCFWSWLDTSITLFLSETKWQYKRWILSLLHSKSLFT